VEVRGGRGRRESVGVGWGERRRRGEGGSEGGGKKGVKRGGGGEGGGRMEGGWRWGGGGRGGRGVKGAGERGGGLRGKGKELGWQGYHIYRKKRLLHFLQLTAHSGGKVKKRHPEASFPTCKLAFRGKRAAGGKGTREKKNTRGAHY